MITRMTTGTLAGCALLMLMTSWTAHAEERVSLDNPPSLKSAYNQGVKLFGSANKALDGGQREKARKEFSMALAYLVKAFDARPDNCMVMYLLGRTYERLGENRLSFMFYKRLLDTFQSKGKLCGWNLTDKYDKSIRAAMSQMEITLSTQGYKKTVLDRSLLGSYEVRNCRLILGDQHAAGRVAPKSIELPATAWYPRAQRDAAFACAGERTRLAIPGGGDGYPPPPLPPGQWRWKKSTTWIAVGTGVVGSALLAGGLGLFYSKANRDADEDNLKDEWKDRTQWMNLGFGLATGGGMLLGAGLGWTILDCFRPDTAGKRVEIRPAIIEGGGGLTLGLDL